MISASRIFRMDSLRWPHTSKSCLRRSTRSSAAMHRSCQRQDYEWSGYIMIWYNDTSLSFFIILYPHENCPFIDIYFTLIQVDAANSCAMLCAHHLASTANFTPPVLSQWADDEPRALQARAFHTNLTQMTQVRLQRNLLQRSSKTWIDFKLRSWT